jgi:hypothetical protein
VNFGFGFELDRVRSEPVVLPAEPIGPAETATVFGVCPDAGGIVPVVKDLLA